MCRTLPGIPNLWKSVELSEKFWLHVAVQITDSKHFHMCLDFCRVIGLILITLVSGTWIDLLHNAAESSARLFCWNQACCFQLSIKRNPWHRIRDTYCMLPFILCTHTGPCMWFSSAGAKWWMMKGCLKNRDPAQMHCRCLILSASLLLLQNIKTSVLHAFTASFHCPLPQKNNSAL